MNDKYQDIWETYTSSWKVVSKEEKQKIYNECLDEGCEYSDPLVKTKGWDELVNYMLEFHKQVPGGHFKTYYFLAHNNQSVAKWNMLNGDGDVIGKGNSYGRYNDVGKLISMTGFYELP